MVWSITISPGARLDSRYEFCANQSRVTKMGSL
jgi:hypothetical protein